jgi:signal transduction histidine kinase
MLYMNIKTEHNFYSYIEDVLHDVKTPTSVIFSALQTMDSLCNSASCGNSDIARLSGIARRECFNVMRLLRDVADIGKLVNERMPALTPHNLVPIVERICESAAIAAKMNSVGIIFDTNCEEAYAECNRDYAQRLFYNILSNAIKHSPVGSYVEVKITRKSEFVRIYVSDEGEGIGPDGTGSELFGRYVTGDGKLGSASSGIGLAIVREIAGMFDWTVKIKNRKGARGAVCVVKAPVASYENLCLDLYGDGLYTEKDKPVWDLSEWLV